MYESIVNLTLNTKESSETHQTNTEMLFSAKNCAKYVFSRPASQNILLTVNVEELHLPKGQGIGANRQSLCFTPWTWHKHSNVIGCCQALQACCCCSICEYSGAGQWHIDDRDLGHWQLFWEAKKLA
uniref:Uncharacterized protein n=1 Tax=Romanomermis culicivorax TaxID=13658 RepID=A0A915JCR5_ROMCU